MKAKLSLKITLIVIAVALLFFIAWLFSTNMVLFDPKGPVGAAQQWLILVSVFLMAIIIIPVFIMTVYFPYKYRHSNKKADYQPNWEHSTKIEALVWAIPCLIILALGWITYQTAFSLDPRRELESDKPPLTIQVVAMNWKWLFIYPEKEIATVNEIVFPIDRPVRFLVTSDTTMNSFFIPQLGSQVYAMAGMENRLNLMASEEGTYRGLSANYSGFGFTNMRFEAHATDESGFDEWLYRVRSSEAILNDEAYEYLVANERDQLVEPHPVTYFSTVDPLRFRDIIQKHVGVQNGLSR